MYSSLRLDTRHANTSRQQSICLSFGQGSTSLLSKEWTRWSDVTFTNTSPWSSGAHSIQLGSIATFTGQSSRIVNSATSRTGCRQSYWVTQPT